MFTILILSTHAREPSQTTYIKLHLSASSLPERALTLGENEARFAAGARSHLKGARKC